MSEVQQQNENNNVGNNQNDADQSNDKNNIDDKSLPDYTKYIVYGLCAIVTILLLYYAYSRFVENSVDEPFVKGQSPERSDAAADYNLHEAVYKLENMQKRILRSVSDEVWF